MEQKLKGAAGENLATNSVSTRSAAVEKHITNRSTGQDSTKHHFPLTTTLQSTQPVGKDHCLHGCVAE